MITLNTPQPARCNDPLVKASRLAYLMWERPDLDKADRFLNDFGLVSVEKSENDMFHRAYEKAPFCYWVKKGNKARFIGWALEVSTEQDLQVISKQFQNCPIESHPGPCGGKMIKLTDPAGFELHVVWGLSRYPALPTRSPISHNTAYTQERVNATQRSETRSEVIRLGHVVLEVANFQEVAAWYTQNFGFIPSDVQVLPDGSPAVAFMRLNKGDTPADHHTLALAQGFMACYSHSAYEVIDADAVGMGQRLLREQGYKHAWGIGRHILGSQIFDYWNDPWGYKHEHYSDGDCFTADQPTGIHEVTKEAMSQWGQPMPGSFTKPKMTPSAIAALIKNLNTVPDLTFKKLVTLAKLFG
jgi:hypothetical protein